MAILLPRGGYRRRGRQRLPAGPNAAADSGAEAILQGVTVETVIGREERAFTAEALFVATGGQPNGEGIGLRTVEVETGITPQKNHSVTLHYRTRENIVV